MGKKLKIPPFWVRYVDDVLAAVKRQGATLVLASFNNISKKIAFTIETEMVDTLPFLDVKTMIKDAKVVFDIHRKITHNRPTIPIT